MAKRHLDWYGNPYPCHRQRSYGGLATCLALFLAVAAAIGSTEQPAKPAAHPAAPAPPRVVTKTVTQTVYVHLHPALTGTDWVLIVFAVLAAIVACVAIIGRRWGN